MQYISHLIHIHALSIDVLNSIECCGWHRYSGDWDKGTGGNHCTNPEAWLKQCHSLGHTTESIRGILLPVGSLSIPSSPHPTLSMARMLTQFLKQFPKISLKLVITSDFMTLIH